MQFYATPLAFVALMGVSCAAPTPAGGPADACTTIYPIFMGQIQQDKPNLVATNTVDNDPWFALTQVLSEDHSNISGQLQTYVRFDLPSGAQNCNLHSQFPANTKFESKFGNANPSWSLYGFEQSVDEDAMSWNNVYTDDSAIGVLKVIKPNQANLLDPFVYTNIGCSDNTYVYALSGSQDEAGITDFEVETQQGIGAVGPFMTYGCNF
ncbi:hypothetical protein ACMFMG_003235 [Clarireedia jacksonii]